MEKLTYSLAPRNWAICFQHECPLADKCLRHAVALLAPAELEYHKTVLPGARKGDRCSLYVTTEPVRMARGMKRLLPRGSAGQAMEIRQGLYNIFGSCPQYYRYRAGKYDITPEQQARVAALFRRFSITAEPKFDHTSFAYYFPEP